MIKEISNTEKNERRNHWERGRELERERWAGSLGCVRPRCGVTYPGGGPAPKARSRGARRRRVTFRGEAWGED